MPQGHNLNPCPRAQGCFIDPGVFLIWSLRYFWQNVSLTIFIRWFWGENNLEGRLVALWSLLFLKSELELSIFAQMKALWSLYDHHFHLNHLCPQGMTYNGCLRASGGCVDARVLLSDLWTIFNKMAFSKFLTNVFWGKDVKGGADCIRISFYS